MADLQGKFTKEGELFVCKECDYETEHSRGIRIHVAKKHSPEAEKSGRKQFDGRDEDLVVSKLETAFAYGATDKEACLYADIAEKTLYRYIERNPEFGQRKALLKKRPVLIARRQVIDEMQEQEGAELAWEYLQSKKSDEFGDEMPEFAFQQNFNYEETESGKQAKNVMKQFADTAQDIKEKKDD